MNFLLPQDLGNAILDYLVKQPYKEVSNLIEGLKSLPTANVVQQTQPVVSEESTVDPVKTATDTETETQENAE